MKLLLDIGNSRVKWTCLGRNGLQSMHAAVYTAARMNNWCHEHLAGLTAPEAVIVANVAGEAVAGALNHWCQEQWQLQPAYAETERAAGDLRNSYDNVTDMGVDRWLAMIAARQLYTEPVCIISCGTAVTFDAVAADGRHLGGLIVPGPALMQSLLNTGTRGARTRHELAPELKLGQSTQAGVANGSAYAIAGMIERVIEQLSRDEAGSSVTDWRCLITGGAAAAIMPLCRIEMEAVPDLVLQGLAHRAGQIT